jgi:hypothetical protein
MWHAVARVRLDRQESAVIDAVHATEYTAVLLGIFKADGPLPALGETMIVLAMARPDGHGGWRSTAMGPLEALADWNRIDGLPEVGPQGVRDIQHLVCSQRKVPTRRAVAAAAKRKALAGVDAEPQLRLVCVVAPAAKLDVPGCCFSTFRVRHDVVELEKAALRTSTVASDERTAPAVALPHMPLDPCGNVAAAWRTDPQG